MRVLYDTSHVHPLDRFAYYQTAAIGEFAPVRIDGQSRSRLAAAMKVNQIGDLMVEMCRWETDTRIDVHRTPRLVRAADPECLRILLSIDGGFGAQQAGQTVEFRPSDIALYDTSQPWHVRNLPNIATPKRTIMLTFPRSLIPPDLGGIERHVGTILPRDYTPTVPSPTCSSS